MTIHDVRLIGREGIAEGTVAFHFTRPAGFAFKAGQTIDLTLPAMADAGGDARHTFSLVSAPHESQLTIATRMRASAYKRTLGSLPIGAPAGLEGPFGSLTLHANRARPAVLVAGGIGITPFVSILRQACHERLNQVFVLVHSNRSPREAPFLEELRRLERSLESLRVIATMTHAGSASSHAGPTGRVDGALLAAAMAGLAAPVCYATGSPAFVASMRETLNALGVSDDDIRSEDFAGY
jgi:ferredoxin-NADP reductase